MVANENGLKRWFSDKKRYVLSLALGMLVLFWRSILPMNVEITIGIVILVVVLDLILTSALILINKNELKEALLKKFTWKEFLIIILGFVSYLIIGLAAQVGINALIDSGIVTLPPAVLASPPAALASEKAQMIFPIGIFISMNILAPIWEEIAFRMAGKHLIKNGVLYAVITALLFGFIHTVSFLTIGMVSYLITGITFAIIYLKTRNIRIVIIAHFLVNLLGVIIGLISG